MHSLPTSSCGKYNKNPLGCNQYHLGRGSTFSHRSKHSSIRVQLSMGCLCADVRFRSSSVKDSLCSCLLDIKCRSTNGPVGCHLYHTGVLPCENTLSLRLDLLDWAFSASIARLLFVSMCSCFLCLCVFDSSGSYGFDHKTLSCFPTRTPAAAGVVQSNENGRKHTTLNPANPGPVGISQQTPLNQVTE